MAPQKYPDSLSLSPFFSNTTTPSRPVSNLETYTPSPLDELLSSRPDDKRGRDYSSSPTHFLRWSLPPTTPLFPFSKSFHFRIPKLFTLLLFT